MVVLSQEYMKSFNVAQESLVFSIHEVDRIKLNFSHREAGEATVRILLNI